MVRTEADYYYKTIAIILLIVITFGEVTVAQSSGVIRCVQFCCISKVIEIKFANRSYAGCEGVIRTFSLNTREGSGKGRFSDEQALS